MKKEEFFKKVFVIQQYSSCQGDELIAHSATVPILKIFDSNWDAANGLLEHQMSISDFEGAIVSDVGNKAGVWEMLQNNGSVTEIIRFWIASAFISPCFRLEFFTDDQFRNLNYLNYDEMRELLTLSNAITRDKSILRH
tara:strand:- start:70 stop:486 length:417 start_codon:yes stop_codon:yes gene_type:complete